MKIALVILLMGFLPALRAQLIPTVRIDPHSRVAQQTAPFDHVFYLQLPVDSNLQSDELKQLDLFKLVKKKGKTIRTLIKSYDAEGLQKAWFVDSPKEAGFKYLKVYIDTQLLPYTRFSVILTLNPSHFYIDALNKINFEMALGKWALAKKDYQDLSGGLKIKYSNNRAKWPPFDREEGSPFGDFSYHQFFLDSLRPFYEDLSAEDTAIVNNLSRLRDTLKSTGFRFSELFNCNCQKDFIANELFADSTKFLIPLHNLLNVPDALPYFATAKLNIQEFEPYRQTKAYDIHGRVDNYGRLKGSLLNISYFFHLSSFADSISPQVKNGIYNAIFDALVAIDARVKELQQDSARIRSVINGEIRLFSAEISYGGTSPTGEDLKTSSGHYVIADLGLANAGTFAYNKFGYVVRPYLGVNFSFVAIDKSQPLDNIENRRLLHRLSFVLGLTTSPLTSQGTYDLINNLSVVGGFAYRINRSLRITFGTLVYKRDAANPLLPPQVTAGPMVALSLDLDVANWFSSLKSKLF